MAVKRVASNVDIVTAARQRIKNVFSNGVPVYMSFSGGKDSLCLADLTLKLIQAGEIDPALLTVLFIDEEAIFDCIEETAKAWRKKFLLAGAKFQWGVALLPYWPDVKGAPQNTVIGGAAIWAMAGHSQDAEKGSAAFLNYLLKPEVQARFHQLTGYVPVPLEGYELTKQQGFYDKNPGTDIAVKALSDKKPTINSLGLRLGNFVQIRNIIDEELEGVWAGKKTAKQALDAAVERGNAELARFAKANRK